jgi:DNA-binding IclR family transcriptional regulator
MVHGSIIRDYSCAVFSVRFPDKEDMVQSIERAISILNAFSADEPEYGVVELSRHLDLPKSTVYRLLNALEQGGLINQNQESGKYRLGLGLITLANNVLAYTDLQRIARPYLRHLADELQETVNLSVLDRAEVINLEQFVSPERLVLRVGWVGRRMPAHAVSSGRAILAFMPAEDFRGLLEGPLSAHTPNTITDPKELLDELSRVRKQGYAATFEEFEVGLNAVSAPVRDHKGIVVASVSVSGPAYRVTQDRVPEIGAQVVRATHKITREMGCLDGLGAA